MKKLLILGISGFTGRHFEAFLHENGHAKGLAIIGADRNLECALHTGSIRYYAFDAENPAKIRSLLAEERPDAVVNLIGKLGSGDSDSHFRTNLDIPRHLFEAILELGLKTEKILVVGSAAEYGFPKVNPIPETAPACPVNLYGLTKALQTEMARYYHRANGLPIVIARTFNLLGEGLSTQLSIGSFMAQIEGAEEGGSIRVGNINTSRDFMEVQDAVACYWELLSKGTPGEVYNVCSGRPRTIRDILERLIERSGKQLSITVDPDRMKKDDVSLIYGDPSKYKKMLGVLSH